VGWRIGHGPVLDLEIDDSPNVVAYRAIGQFRWRAKEELLRRGLDDESPAARGSALLSLELMSRDHPSTINSVRPLLHTMATADGNGAVRRLAILSLKNGSPQRETIVLLEGLARATRPTRSFAVRHGRGAAAQAPGSRNRRSTNRTACRCAFPDAVRRKGRPAAAS
jgi:hypothetical protein